MHLNVIPTLDELGFGFLLTNVGVELTKFVISCLQLSSTTKSLKKTPKDIIIDVQDYLGKTK